MLSPKSVKKWESVAASELSGIKGVCLDIDDTLSSHGKLTPQAYASLWRLKEKGLMVVPITGRPAGWCDQIVRFWPVDAVVGENGAFTFYMDNTSGRAVRKKFTTPGADPDSQKKILELHKKILNQFPFAKVASDQNYREYDLAIDICEDVAPWKEADVSALLDLCHQSGAHAKLSSIHVNTWFGNYDKKTGFKSWLEAGALGLKGATPQHDEWIYIGDSPNDEPMFEYFTHSVGVANLGRYLASLKFPPVWITNQESGDGFCEMVKTLTGQ
jgi:HAD superfamily hydrolase (TIGR01484 family)